MRYIIIVFISLICFSAEAQNIQLSFKVILNPTTGNRPSYATEDYINITMDFMDDIMCKSGRGITFSREPTIEIGGIGNSISINYFNLSPSSSNKSILENEAENDIIGFAWRSNRINIYLNGNSGSGVCSIPGNDSNAEIILIGVGNLGSSTVLHEIGHFFSLCHTQGCPCGNCSSCSSPQSDDVDDTLEDSDCWDQDGIANNTYSQSYAQLSTSQQEQVDNTFYNIMSYHDNRNRLTEGQLDRFVQAMFDYSNRQNVVSTLPIYADDNTGCSGCSSCTGSPTSLIIGIDCTIDKLESVSNRNIIVLKPGTYNITDNRVISKSCLITGTSGGDAIIE